MIYQMEIVVVDTYFNLFQNASEDFTLNVVYIWPNDRFLLPLFEIMGNVNADKLC